MTQLDLIDRRRWWDRLLADPERVFVALLFLSSGLSWWLDPGRTSDFGLGVPPHLTAVVRTLYLLGGPLVLAGVVRGRRNIEAAGLVLSLAGTTASFIASLLVSKEDPMRERVLAAVLVFLASTMLAARLVALRRPLKAELRSPVSGSIVLKADD